MPKRRPTLSVIKSPVDDHKEFNDWIEQGITRGWCSPPVCGSHEDVPTAEWEDELTDEGHELCQTVVRLYGPYAPDEHAARRVYMVHTQK